MKNFFSFALLLSTLAGAQAASIYSDSLDLNKYHKNIKLTDVEFKVIPSKTETRRIPGCTPRRGEMEHCYEVVVLERLPVVQVTVDYKDGVFVESDRRINRKYFTLNLKPEAFSEAALLELQSISKLDLRGRHMNLRKEWAARNVELEVNLVKRDIQVVDMRTSRFCRRQGERNPTNMPGCVEVINYKPGITFVKEVKVVVKE